MNPEEIRKRLSQITSSDVYYEISEFKDIKYTEGINQFVLLCSCKWLLLDILSVLSTKLKHIDNGFICISKERGSQSCLVDYLFDDGLEAHQKIYESTNFPLSDYYGDRMIELAATFLYVDRVLLLPSEDYSCS